MNRIVMVGVWIAAFFLWSYLIGGPIPFFCWIMSINMMSGLMMFDDVVFFSKMTEDLDPLESVGCFWYVWTTTGRPTLWPSRSMNRGPLVNWFITMVNHGKPPWNSWVNQLFRLGHQFFMGKSAISMATRGYIYRPRYRRVVDPHGSPWPLGSPGKHGRSPWRMAKWGPTIRRGGPRGESDLGFLDVDVKDDDGG